jgi:hypothetical protein
MLQRLTLIFNTPVQLRWVGQWLLWLWALPLTLCGLLVWLWVCFEQAFFKQHSAQAQVFTAQPATVFVAHSSSLNWLLRHHPLGPMDAMAIGCCVLARDAPTLQRTLAHELVHVRQAMQWGPLFPLAYCASSAWAWARGRCPYAGNVFEIQAHLSDTHPNKATRSPAIDPQSTML